MLAKWLRSLRFEDIRTSGIGGGAVSTHGASASASLHRAHRFAECQRSRFVAPADMSGGHDISFRERPAWSADGTEPTITTHGSRPRFWRRPHFRRLVRLRSESAQAHFSAN
jgi:hypothetical protein